MGMAEMVHSEQWKTWTNRVYSVGAAIVLLGALGKLNHWAIGSITLTIGMATEVLIFLVSSLEPPLNVPSKEDFKELIDATKETSGGGNSGQFDRILEKADIGPDVLAKVKKGLLDFSRTASGIAEISSASFATGEYVSNLNAASEAMETFKDANTRAAHVIEKSTKDVEKSTKELVQSYDQSTLILNNSTKDLAESFNDSARKLNEQLNQTGNELSKSYKVFTETLNKDISTINDHTKAYSTGLSHINASLSALNLSYELHLENVKKVNDSSSEAIKSYSKVTEIVNGTIEDAQNYRKQAERLNKNIEALNHIYGNMLGAMNAKG